jgi:type IV pilus assembly protein PilB
VPHRQGPRARPRAVQRRALQDPAATFERIPQEFCQENLVLPVGQVGDFLLVAFANPFEVTVPAKIQEMTGKRVVRLLAREKDIRDKFNQGRTVQSEGFRRRRPADRRGVRPEAEGEIKDDDVNEESGPIIQLANRIIEDAYFAGASDIHIEPWEKEIIVRYRIDGICQEKLRLPAKVGPALVARLKIMCNLDIAERRLPQDGRIVFKQFTKKNIDIDLRVSTAPLNHGEGVVMRILDKQKSTLPLPALGFTEENLAKYRECIRQPYGMILHCGPTGSGKSMTLYSALNEINTPDIVIRTAEDPIEYTLPASTRCRCTGRSGSPLRRRAALLPAAGPRHHPRGRNSRQGDGGHRRRGRAHRPPAHLHAAHQRRALARRPPHRHGHRAVHDLLVAALRLRPAPHAPRLQDLPRALRARGPREGDAPEGHRLERPDLQGNPKGCPKCNGSGYKGRVGIHELMVTNEELIEAINKEAETAELKRSPCAAA